MAAFDREATEPMFLVAKWKSSLRKLYGRDHDLVNRYGVSVTNDHEYVPFVIIIIRSFFAFMTYHPGL